jgi:hypothetical protein
LENWKDTLLFWISAGPDGYKEALRALWFRYDRGVKKFSQWAQRLCSGARGPNGVGKTPTDRKKRQLAKEFSGELQRHSAISPGF